MAASDPVEVQMVARRQPIDTANVTLLVDLIDGALAYASLNGAPGTLIRRLEGIRFLVKGLAASGGRELATPLQAAVADAFERYARWRQR